MCSRQSGPGDKIYLDAASIFKERCSMSSPARVTGDSLLSTWNPMFKTQHYLKKEKKNLRKQDVAYHLFHLALTGSWNFSLCLCFHTVLMQVYL